jgi:hypothetical protein
MKAWIAIHSRTNAILASLARALTEPQTRTRARRNAPADFRAMVSGFGERQCYGQFSGRRGVTAPHIVMLSIMISSRD